MSNILSILLYLFIFFLSISICHNKQRYFESLVRVGKDLKPNQIHITKKLIVVIFAIILPPVLLAAYRGNTVGVDTVRYIDNFESLNDYQSYLSGLKDAEFQFLYYSIGYFISWVTGSVRLYFGVFQMLTLLPVLVIGIKKCKIIPVWMVLSVYYFMFFNDSLNVMRQYVSAGCLLLAFLYYEEKNLKKAFTLYIVAMGFHTSAFIIGIAIVFIFYILHSKWSGLYKMVGLLAFFLFFYFMGDLVEVLIQMKILPSRYIHYVKVFFWRTVDSEWIIKESSLGAIFEICIRTIIVTILLMYHKKRKYNNYLFMTIIGLLFYTLCIFVLHTSYGGRITIYFDYFYILLIPRICEASMIQLKGMRKKMHIAEMILLIFYWVIHVAVLGSGGTIPFVAN